jgi:hypothetical protein
VSSMICTLFIHLTEWVTSPYMNKSERKLNQKMPLTTFFMKM